MSQIKHIDIGFDKFLLHALEDLQMTLDDLSEMGELSPYLILDGHRTGIKLEIGRASCRERV